MVRRKGTSRVSPSGSGSSDGPVAQPRQLPSLRERRPVMYWIVVIAVVAMLVTTMASFVTALT